MKHQKLAIGADHAGYVLKEQVKELLIQLGYEVIDFGTYSKDRSDYPDFAHPVALAVESKQAHFGILVCGSGNGVNMAANKHKDIRSALCWNKETAELARLHNDANIIALPSRFIDSETAMDMVKIFLTSPFEGGRHQARVEKISC
jgi:ribose 5-phosphate isomerase B